MRILMVFHVAPYPPNSGVAKRNFHLFWETAKRHDVSVVSFGAPDDERLFRNSFGAVCKQIIFLNNKMSGLGRRLKLATLFLGCKSSFFMLYSRRLQQVLDSLAGKTSFDIIHFRTSLLAVHRLPSGVPLVGDMHNIEYDNIYRAYRESKSFLRKLYYGVEYRRAKPIEIELGKKFDVLLATSERDRQLLRSELPDTKMHVVPNGVDLEFFHPQNQRPEPRTMVFTGLMNYYPNNHGALFFLDHIFPQILSKEPDARFFIVGANPSRRILKRATKNVIITGYVDDVRPYVSLAEVCVIPLLIGGGTRLKVLEAMAMKKPIVSTTLGCEGIDLKHGESVLYADTPEEFARAVLRLFSEPELRSRLVKNAYATVVKHYSWQSIGEELERVHQSVVTKNPTNKEILTRPTNIAAPR